MIAAGIDLGGTKIEAQLFDHDWQVVDRKRVVTPKDYPGLVAAIADLIAWGDATAGQLLPIGIGAAGLLNSTTGLVFAANICASGESLPDDISDAVGRRVTYINDCRAFALSEAVFGAGKRYATVMSLILGTGTGGGIAINGKLLTGPTRTGGEFGHCSAPAALIVQHGLPVMKCGCGRMGCAETYISGPGMERLAVALTGKAMTPREIAVRDSDAARKVWQVWCDMTADMLRNLILTVDPDVIVLGGGLSNIEGIIEDLSNASREAQISDFSVPPIVCAQGGDASGARGAAYAAWQETNQ